MGGPWRRALFGLLCPNLSIELPSVSQVGSLLVVPAAEEDNTVAGGVIDHLVMVAPERTFGRELLPCISIPGPSVA